MLKNAYIYIKKEKIDEILKYGIKLSIYANITFENKKGILAYISPKDSDKYTDKKYEILRIELNKTKSYVHNSSIVTNNILYSISNMCKIEDYILGSYINPHVIISSSILPENIHRYNKILDVPLLIDNSKELYLEKEEEKLNENESFDIEFNNLIKNNK